MKHFNLLLLLIVVLFVLGCDKDLEYPFPGFKSQLVVNASISVEDGLIAKISRSIPPGAEGVYFKDLQVTNAMVELVSEDGQVIPLFHSDSGTYLPDTTFQALNAVKYVLKVSHPDYGNIASDSVRIPQATVEDTVKATITDKLSVNNEQFIRYEIRLQDPAHVQNNYRFVFNNIYAPINRKTSASNSFLRNPSSSSGCSYFSHIGSKFMNDECFNGKAATLIFETEIEKLLIATGGKYVLPSEMSVDIIYLSKEAFDYYRSRKTPEDFEHTFSDPLPLVSNIKGGLGMFIAYEKRQFIFEVPK